MDIDNVTVDMNDIDKLVIIVVEVVVKVNI